MPIGRKAGRRHIAENPVYAMRRAGRLRFALAVVVFYGLRVYLRGLEGEVPAKGQSSPVTEVYLQTAESFPAPPGPVINEYSLVFCTWE